MKITQLQDAKLILNMTPPRSNPAVIMLDGGENLDDYQFERGDLLDALSTKIYFDDVKSDLATIYDVVITKLRNHISDTHCHVSDEERRRWNLNLSKEYITELLSAINGRIDGNDAAISDLLAAINDLPDFSQFVQRGELPDWTIFATKDDIRNMVTTENFMEELLAALGDIDPEEIDIHGYIKEGGFLGSINGIDFYQGSSINVGGGTPGPSGESYKITGLTYANNILSLTQENNSSSPFSVEISGGGGGSTPYVLPVATSDVLGGIKVGFRTNNKKYPVELDTETLQAYVYVPWYPGQPGLSYDDTEIRDLISDLRSDLTELQQDIVDTVQSTVENLFNEEEWLRENFPWNEVFNLDGWDDFLDAYVRKVGIITDTSTVWTSLNLTVLSLDGRVTYIEQHGSGAASITGADIVLKLTEYGYPMAEMKTFYELLDLDLNVILQLASGFRSWTKTERETFASQYSHFKSTTESGLASVNTSITTLNGKIDNVSTSLTSMYTDIVNGTTTISGVLTTANADTALATLFAQSGSLAMAAVVANVTGDQSTIQLIASEVIATGNFVAQNGTFTGDVVIGDVLDYHIYIGEELGQGGDVNIVSIRRGRDVITQIGGVDKVDQSTTVNFIGDNGDASLCNGVIEWDLTGAGHIGGMHWSAGGYLNSIQMANYSSIQLGQSGSIQLTANSHIQFDQTARLKIGGVLYTVSEDSGYLKLTAV